MTLIADFNDASIKTKCSSRRRYVCLGARPRVDKVLSLRKVRRTFTGSRKSKGKHRSQNVKLKVRPANGDAAHERHQSLGLSSRFWSFAVEAALERYRPS